MEPQEKKSNGALIGSIVIIVILIIGGIYIWQTKMKTVLEEKTIESEELTPVDSEELNTLEEDLNMLETEVDVDVESLN